MDGTRIGALQQLGCELRWSKLQRPAEKPMDEYTVGDAVKDAQDVGSKATDVVGEAARKGGEAILNTPLEAVENVVLNVIVWGLGAGLLLLFLAWVGRN